MNSYHKTSKQMGASVFADYPAMFKTMSGTRTFDEFNTVEWEREHFADTKPVEANSWDASVQVTLQNAGKSHVYRNENKVPKRKVAFSFKG
jgi:hypothetical protein